MKTTNKKIKMIVEKTDTGFSAFSEDYPIYTTGRTIPELIDNALEAAWDAFVPAIVTYDCAVCTEMFSSTISFSNVFIFVIATLAIMLTPKFLYK